MKGTDYIIIQDNGEPVRFPNGDVVVYGNYQECTEDTFEGDKIVQIDFMQVEDDIHVAEVFLFGNESNYTDCFYYNESVDDDYQKELQAFLKEHKIC